MSLTQYPQPAVSPVTAPADARRPRPALWRRWGFWFVLAVVGCFAAVGGRYYERHRQLAIVVQASLEALDRDDPGWRLQQIEAARAAVADRDNAALGVIIADDLLTLKDENFGPRQILQRQQPNERPWDDELKKLREELNQRQSAIDKARELADRPQGRFAIAYQRNFFQMPRPEIEQVNRVSSLLCDDALLRAADGDANSALRSCRAALNAGRSYGDEPFALTQLKRIERVHLACRAVQRVLGLGEAGADDLRALQQLLADEERYPRLLVMARGERALVNDLIEAVESGDVPLADLLKAAATGSPQRNTFFYSLDAVRTEHPAVLQALTETVAIARLPAYQRPGRIDAYEARLKAESPSLLYDLTYDFRKLDETVCRVDARLRCLITALAVERYRLANGGWPASLSDLKPDLLAEVLADPEDGEPLGFRRYADRVVVYSRHAVPIGSLVVNGGPPRAFNPEEPPVVGAGVAVHLFDVKNRRQTPTETKPAPMNGPPVGRVSIQ